VRSFQDPIRAYLLARNRVMYMKRFSTRLQFLVFFTVFFPYVTGYYIIRTLLRRNYSALKVHLIGSYHGLLYGLTGRLKDYYATEADR
jgi:hypothetical protein